MKKFYTLALAAIAALSVNAQSLYMVGDGEGLGWDPENPLEAALADGSYTFEVKELAKFKISTEKGGWDDAFNPNGVNIMLTKDNLGQEIDVTKGASADIATPWVGDYKIVINADLTKAVVTTTTPAPEGPTVIYFRGDMNNWGNDDAEQGIVGAEELAKWQFTFVSTDEQGDHYTFTCKDGQMIEAGQSFKIADAKWAKVNYSAGTEIALDDVSLWKAGIQENTTLAEDWNGTCTIIVPADPTLDAPVMFTNENSGDGVESIEADNNAAPVYYNLQGVRVANAENGLFIVKKGNKVSKVFVK